MFPFQGAVWLPVTIPLAIIIIPGDQNDRFIIGSAEAYFLDWKITFKGDVLFRIPFLEGE